MQEITPGLGVEMVRDRGPPHAMVFSTDPVQRGERMAVIAGCRFCHTPANERAQPLPGMRNAGGLGMPANGATIYSANITPDPDTGIGTWSEQDFIARFKAFEGARSEIGGWMAISDVAYSVQRNRVLDIGV